MRCRRSAGAFYMEYALFIAAVVLAATLMWTYVRASVRANLKQTEMQLNGAMWNNVP